MDPAVQDLRAKRGSLTVEVSRGGFLESLHEVSIVVYHSINGVVDYWGDTDQLVFPRSSIKMLQALPLARAARSNRVKLRTEQLALATASHGGEPMHASLAEGWLSNLGLPEETLHCGAHAPYFAEAARDLIRAGLSPRRFHNNCSGKHVGMIQACLLMGFEPRGYFQASHPLQKKIGEVLGLFGGLSEPLKEWGIDGCGIPAWRMPLVSVARAMALFGSLAVATTPTPETGEPALAEWAGASSDLYFAMTKHPLLIGGHDDYSSQMTAAGAGRLIVKVGAEGFMTAAIPELNLGLALKVRDGAERAAEAAMSFLLCRLGLFGEASDPSIDSRIRRNWAREVVGEIRVNVRSSKGL